MFFLQLPIFPYLLLRIVDLQKFYSWFLTADCLQLTLIGAVAYCCSASLIINYIFVCFYMIIFFFRFMTTQPIPNRHHTAHMAIAPTQSRTPTTNNLRTTAPNQQVATTAVSRAAIITKMAALTAQDQLFMMKPLFMTCLRIPNPPAMLQEQFIFV